MSAKRLVVIGTSAGGIDALRTVIGGLPAGFPAAIAIVLHTSPDSPGVMHDILGRAGRLPTSLAHDGQRLDAGHIYIAPPDRHLVVEPGRLRVTKGPREHRFRPAIDPLFRSAAQVFGPAAIGVILTGNLDDGTAGLWTIARLGGVAIVQDPSDAQFSSMPLNAMRHVEVDHVVPLSQIPSLLVALTSDAPAKIAPVTVPPHLDLDVKIAKEHNPRDAGLEHMARPSPYSCPECHGVLLEFEEGGRLRLRCHIGHAYSVESLVAAMHEGIEYAMGAAQRSLEEGSLLMKRIATDLEQRHHGEESMRMRHAADQAARRSDAMKELMRETDPVSAADH